MSFFVNVNYAFKMADDLKAEGSVIPAVAMPLHTLEGRGLPSIMDPPPEGKGKPKKIKHHHLMKRLFDPQLYLAELDATKSDKACAVLSSYPWFAVPGITPFDPDGEQDQSDWRAAAREIVRESWPGHAPDDPDTIELGVKAAVDFQIRNGMWGIILPSPLTRDPTSSYDLELEWLDAGLSYIKTLDVAGRPVFATIAISDLVIHPHADPAKNPILELILDAITAREVQGVYIVIEQFIEGDDTRQCGSDRTLLSLLHLIHRFANESFLQVGVNFMGAFGLACQAAGAAWWASNWYKSLYRFRLADKLSGGRRFPLYWSAAGALDIHLEEDFDKLAKASLKKISDSTPYSDGLLAAAKQGKKAKQVVDWESRQSNVAASMNHYLASSIQADARYSKMQDGQSQLEFVEDWLATCEETGKWAAGILGREARTKIGHAAAWAKAFRDYRKAHRS
jgi:hypothetical protein